MRRRGLEPMHDEHVNVTPLIDVMMCLVIFFLACSRLAKSEANDQVQIPRAALGQEMPEQRGRLLINIIPRNKLATTDTPATVNPMDEPDIMIRGNQIGLSDLTAFLRKEKLEAPDLKVILRADQDLPYNWISPVLVSCAQADIRSVNFSTPKVSATMIRRGPLKKMSANVGPNMTPMVDVVMCILIFFMLGSTFAVRDLFLKSNTAAIRKEGLGTEQGLQELPAVRMNIVLKHQGTDTWVSAFDDTLMKMNKIDDLDQGDNQKIFDKLAQRRKTISDDVQVLIVPDKQVSYQDVITIYDYCTKLQFKQVAFYPAK